MNVSFDLSKTLESLENDYWGEPTYSSYLVRTCHELRTKPLQSFEVEDLRILIGQDIGLVYLIPLAINVLSTNILAEGDMYEGDLLTNVLRSDVEYWKANKLQWELVVALMGKDENILQNFDTTHSIKKEWVNLHTKFKTYYS
jgi:hypothetical protein